MDGKHKDAVIIGDCLDVMADLPEGSVDLCVTDPPWGIAYRSTREKFANELIENDGLKEYQELMDKFTVGLYRILSQNGTAYVFCGGTTPVIPGKKETRSLHWPPADSMDRFWRAGFTPRRVLVWDKATPGMGYRYRFKVEFVLYFTKGKNNIFYGGGEYKNEIIICDPQVEMIRYNKIHGSNKVHPAEKPVRIYESFIRDSTEPGDLVMDPFAGSGTVIEACINSGRRYLAIEKNERYRRILERRGSQRSLFGAGDRMSEQIDIMDEIPTDNSLWEFCNDEKDS